MVEKATTKSPAYATYSSFVSFINNLRDTGIPGRIDPSVFGRASGSLIYSTISALKSLNLTDANGVPTEVFVRLVKSSDADRKEIWREVLKSAYTTLWDGSIDLKSATAGQFDQHIREQYDLKGSTIDKVAAFFISAAKAADIPLSTHLKARKQIASSSSSRKTIKQRKSNADDQGNNNGSSEKTQQQPTPPMSDKALEYKLVDLLNDDDIGSEQETAIWTLIRHLTAKNKHRNKAAE